MQPKVPARPRVVLFCCIALLIVMGGSRASIAAGEYVLDIKGTVEIVGERGLKDAQAAGSEVHYWVYFQYRDPNVEGPSFLDRPAQVEENGEFNVAGLMPGKVYRVFVQRVIIDPSLPGGGSREEIPLDVPADFWASVDVSSQAAAPEPVRIELAVVAPGGSSEPPRSLSLQYNGKQVRLAAYTAGPGVS